MIKKYLIIIVLSLLGLFWLTRNTNNKATTDFNKLLKTSDYHVEKTHPLTFFDKSTFYSGIEQTKNAKVSSSYQITGGIIPHHLFPSFIIADFFNRLKDQQPPTIILIGPNHQELGNFQALTSLYAWQTPFGIVQPQEDIIKELLNNNLVKIDEKILPTEHSVAGIMPFIKYYLPSTKVVPIILSGFMTFDQVQILADNLKNYTPDMVVISAVDFSHYLTSPQAQEKDHQTLKIMENFNYKQLFLLNNDYLDSPPSIATLLMVMQTQGAKMDLLYHTNSGQLQKNPFVPTTSYFSIAYHQ